MTELDLLKDCFRRLNAIGVAYMLTGSMASNAWGIPRTTHDFDFVIRIPPAQVPKLAGAFRDAYFVDELAIQAAFNPPHQFNVIHVPSALKIDFWMLRATPFEQEMFRRRQSHRTFGEAAWLATPEDLILHKLYWHTITPSDRQIGDVAGIVAVQKGRLDEAYLRRWASELRVTELLEDVLAGKLRPKQT